MKNLPKGNITKRKINNKFYYYYQWTENGKQRNKIIKEDELDDVLALIEERKKMEKTYIAENDLYFYNCDIRVGHSLLEFVDNVKKYNKRFCFEKLINYLFSDNEKVFILYGLRRTGKTTLIKQAILSLDSKQFSKAVYIKVNRNNSLANLNQDLKQLEKLGYKYIFIDEITMLDDFIEGSALLSDIYVASNMRIVLSGTDSLGFSFASKYELYDRSVLLHTTYISYKEFEDVLGIKGIDKYIEYGGAMSIDTNNYNEDSIFSNKDNINQYLDSAICHNIEHSLKNYKYGTRFLLLKELYNNNELTNAINRIVEDVNHEFAIDVLTRPFKSHDVRSGANLLRKDKTNPLTILDDVDTISVTNRLKQELEIIDKEKQKTRLNDSHISQIKDYLKILDLIDYIKIDAYGEKISKDVFTQPALRYSQVKLLFKSLIQDPKFSDLDLKTKQYVLNKIDTDAKGRMLEDIIILDTTINNPNKNVVKYIDENGEIDMIVSDENTCTSDIYEIKHSDKIVEKQYSHLQDNKLCELIEHKYGTINSKNVLYNGISTKKDNINYINIEDYLTV